MAVMRDPATLSATVLLAAVWLAACSGGAARAPVVTAPVPPGYLGIVAVAPGYVAGPTSGDRWVIYLSGFIDTGATARLEQLLVRRDIRRAIIYLDSPGGHLVEAVHRAENRVAVADEAAFQGAVASQATEYLAAMGVSVDLVALMAGVPHAAIREIPAAEASRLRLLTGPVPARQPP